MTDHQKNQIKVINKIEDQIKGNSINFSTVTPVKDFENDPRVCLTSVHFPANTIKSEIYDQIINPLKSISPEFYYYPSESLHLTIKNIRVINDPPHFTSLEIEKAKQVFSKVIPTHKKYNVYFYRLLLFPSNLALIGTTDPELDEIILDLDKKLSEVGVPDDKKYVNSKYFFCNMTLVRFNHPATQKFIDKVNELSSNINLSIYIVDSVSLIKSNAVMNNLQIIDTWELR